MNFKKIAYYTVFILIILQISRGPHPNLICVLKTVVNTLKTKHR